MIASVALIAGIASGIHGDKLQWPCHRPDSIQTPSIWVNAMFPVLAFTFQQEIWQRALLQSALSRLWGNRWLGLASTAVLISSLQPSGQQGFALCSAVLLGVVFIRTRSVLSTTAVSLTVGLPLGMLQGGPLASEGLLARGDFLLMKPPLLLGLLSLAVAVELWYRRSPRLLQSIKAAARTLLLMAFAYALYKLTAILLAPLWQAVIGRGEWMKESVVVRMALLVSAAVPVMALAWLRRGPSLRELLALWPVASLGLVGVAAWIPAIAAAIAIPDALRVGAFTSSSPLTANPRAWLGAALPLVVAALQEELVHRALVQSLLSRLFRSEWVGLVLGALHFTAFHPLESAVFVLPGGLLFGLVFMRTRSIACTTLLHLTLNIATHLLHTAESMRSLFLSPDNSDAKRIAVGGLILVLTAAFEGVWRWSAHRRGAAGLPNERAAPASLAP